MQVLCCNASEVQICNICHTEIHMLMVGYQSSSFSKLKLGELNLSMKVSSEDLNLQQYDAILVVKISKDVQNICNFVPMNTVSKCRRLFINMV